MSITWGEVKSQVRALMDEYSSRGALLPTTKVADVVKKMEQLVNEAQYDLATTKAFIPALYTFTRTLKADPTEYDLPDDFFDLYYFEFGPTSGPYYNFYNYRITPNGKVVVDKELYPYTVRMHYKKTPTKLALTGNPTDDALTFEINDDAVRIMPYYIAGNVLISERDSANGTIRLNQYYDKRNELISNEQRYKATILSRAEW